MKAFAIACITLTVLGCATTKPVPARAPEPLHGVASWYGEEFAGRTTANGEIFDPMQLTAAHRSLPFGTVLEVTNAKTNQTVRVRVNDRGPFIGNRLIDLSYAAAQQIGLVEPGTGEVDLKIVTVGRGDHEPPAPYVVAIDTTTPKETAVINSGEPPAVAFPLPSQTPGTAPADFNVSVTEERHGVPTRRQVTADGKAVQEVAVADDNSVTPMEKKPVEPARPTTKAAATLAKHGTEYVVQVGAFSIEANAKALQDQLSKIGQKAHIDHASLFFVRIGPFNTRDEAVKVRTALETSGMSAIIMAE